MSSVDVFLDKRKIMGVKSSAVQSNVLFMGRIRKGEIKTKTFNYYECGNVTYYLRYKLCSVI